MRIAALFGVIFLLAGYKSFCQQKAASITTGSDDLYLQYMGVQANIYNGREYMPYNFHKEGHPFYVSDSLSEGWISYEGRTYALPLLYDVSRDQVVIKNRADGARIVLQNERMDSFHLSGHTFKKLLQNAAQQVETTGFYDRLYSGSVEVWALRKKRFTETIEGNMVVRYFSVHDRFYILKNGKYNEVKNEKDVFEYLSGNRKQIKRALRKQGLKFRRSKFESALVIAARLSDQSKH